MGSVEKYNLILWPIHVYIRHQYSQYRLQMPCKLNDQIDSVVMVKLLYYMWWISKASFDGHWLKPAFALKKVNRMTKFG